MLTNYRNFCPCHSLIPGFDVHAHTFICIYKSMLLRVIWESTRVPVLLCLTSACEVLLNTQNTVF